MTSRQRVRLQKLAVLLAGWTPREWAELLSSGEDKVWASEIRKLCMVVEKKLSLDEASRKSKKKSASPHESKSQLRAKQGAEKKVSSRVRPSRGAGSGPTDARTTYIEVQRPRATTPSGAEFARWLKIIGDMPPSKIALDASSQSLHRPIQVGGVALPVNRKTREKTTRRDTRP